MWINLKDLRVNKHQHERNKVYVPDCGSSQSQQLQLNCIFVFLFYCAVSILLRFPPEESITENNSSQGLLICSTYCFCPSWQYAKLSLATVKPKNIEVFVQPVDGIVIEDTCGEVDWNNLRPTFLPQICGGRNVGLCSITMEQNNV